MSSSRDHWADHARRWAHVRPPLRPSEEDVAIVEGMIAAHFGAAPLRILLLGVTPELATSSFAPGSSLVAVEQNEAMIAHVFRPGPQRSVRRATWQSLPFEDASFDLVLGDGCFTTLPTKDDYRVVCGELRRVLRRSGALIHRFFVRPEAPEPLDRVFSDLAGRKIERLEVFKWRLAMALVDPRSETVELDDIYRVLVERLGPDLAELFESGFTPEAIATLAHYRGARKRYTFPRYAALAQWLSPHFTLLDTKLPTYELGERCPITLSRPAAG